jgi:hypothetical protein
MLTKIRRFLYGMIGYEFEAQAVEIRSSMESLFMVVTFGDLVGLPVIPSYYAMRLLPFVVPNIATWKRRILREHGFAENPELDLHGL